MNRFWSKVDRSGDCWLWTGAKSEGYGYCRSAGKMSGAHRVSWQMANGQIPGGLHVLHRCDVRSCVNPAHLFLGTNADNMRDRDAKGRQVGSPGERHPAARLTNSNVVLLRHVYAMGGYTQRELAPLFGLSQSAVSAVVRRKTWAK